MKKGILLLLFICFLSFSYSQILKPVKWKVDIEKVTESDYNVIFNGLIDDGWHLYGLNMPENGPIPTNFVFEDQNGFNISGKPVAVIKPEIKFDSILEMRVELIENKALFRQKIKITSDNELKISGSINYMACNDNTCTPPLEEEFTVIIPGKKISVAEEKPDTVLGKTEMTDSVAQNTNASNDMDEADVKSTDNPEEKKSAAGILLLSLVAGLGALLTPCVYPMIPMTVSYFMRDNKNRNKAVAEAFVYGISIILIYTMLGVLVSVFKDPNAVNTVSTHWLLNLIFFIIFVVLAASFFGMFELVLPSGIANKIDKQADKGGYAGAFFMALGMTILSFSCTGPIVASLLIKASEGEVIEPVLGMFGFGLIFAVPFTLFAIFPSWLKNLPRSGTWLNSVKVFIAFILLAFSFYFLAKIDQAYHLNLVPRELFIGFWIVIFVLLGFYFLGKISFPHDTKSETVGVSRFFLSVAAFTFAIYMVPGLFGKNVEGIETLLPPKKVNNENTRSEILLSETSSLCKEPKYSDFLHLPHNLSGYFDYDEALSCAKEQNKPILIDFVGHACVNCKKMYQKVWSDPQVLDILKKDYIIVALYTDDKTKLQANEVYISKVDGKEKNTLGKKNVDFQIEKFNSNALPLYAIVNSEGEVITSQPYYVYNLNVQNFISFLNEGLNNLN